MHVRFALVHSPPSLAHIRKAAGASLTVASVITTAVVLQAQYQAQAKLSVATVPVTATTPAPISTLSPTVPRFTPASPRASRLSAHHSPLAPARNVALIVGINKAHGASTIPGSEADAFTIRDALLMYGFLAADIRMLVGGKATRPAILADLRSLAARASPSGIAVFAVAAHSTRTHFRTAEGAHIRTEEVATLLGRVPGRVWSVFAVCYAGSYNLPGVTGPNRLATFSSTATQQTWEGPHGSDMVRHMVSEGMLDGRASSSVEAAYAFAYAKMRQDGNGPPAINDQVPGNFVLGQRIRRRAA